MKTSSKSLRRAGLLLLGLGAVATTLAFTFSLSETGMPIKWPPGNISLTIMLGDSPTLFDGTTFNTSARTAANSWNAVIGSAQIQSAFATGSPANDNDRNEMGFGATIFGRAFDPGVLAVTTGSRSGNQRLEADIIFNTTAFSWDSYRGSRPPSLPSGTIDLQRVAIHEIGHLLGLDHPDEAGQSVSAIMNSHVSNVDAQTSDDIEGARSIYGPPGVPANDSFANAIAIPLTSSSTTVNGFNTNATKESGEPRHADNSGGHSVWWRWIAPSAGTVTLDTRGSYYDTTLAVYTGTTVSSLTAVASNDDLKLPTQADPTHVQASLVTFTATSGTTYRIAVDGYNNGDDDPSDHNGADSAGITLNLAFTGTLGTPPTISTHPASVTVNSGGNASFSVTATGTDPLSYQWLFNSGTLSGATSSTLSLSSVTSNQAGSYSVTVTNPAGSVTSNFATLTVNTPAPPPPSSGGGGGGGGAPSLWFCAVLAGLGAVRLLGRRNLRPET